MECNLEKLTENELKDNKSFSKIEKAILDIYLARFKNLATKKSIKNVLENILKNLNWTLEVQQLNWYFKNLKAKNVTKNNMITVLRTFIKWLNLKFEGSFDVKEILKFENDLTIRQPLNKNEINFLWKWVRDFGSKDFELTFEFLLTTGCRVGELASIDWKQQTSNNILITTLKTRKTRILSIKKDFFERIQNNGGIKLSKNSIQEYFRRFREFLKENRIVFNKPISAHVLRHTFATKAYLNGLALSDIAYLLGHDDIKTTHSIYIKANAEIQELNFMIANMEMEESYNFLSIVEENKKLKKIISYKDQEINSLIEKLNCHNQLIKITNNSFL